MGVLGSYLSSPIKSKANFFLKELDSTQLCSYTIYIYAWLCSKKIYGDQEMGQCVKCLLFKHEDLSSNPACVKIGCGGVCLLL